MITTDVLGQVAAERINQDMTWGEQDHPDYDSHDIPEVMRNEYAFRAERWKEINARRAEHGCEVSSRVPYPLPCTAWDGILLEEVYEALAEEDPAKRRAELVQVAAVAVAMVEALDRREPKPCANCARLGYTCTPCWFGEGPSA